IIPRKGMSYLRRGLARSIGGVFLLALLSVPLLLTGHRHDGEQPTAGSCPVCVVTAHSPVASVQTAPTMSALLRSVPLAPLSVVARAGVERPSPVGRAPPLLISAT